MTPEQKRVLEDYKIQDCLARLGGLSDWERNFVTSLTKQKKLSDKQIEVLDRIWEDATDKTPTVRRTL